MRLKKVVLHGTSGQLWMIIFEILLCAVSYKLELQMKWSHFIDKLAVCVLERVSTQELLGLRHFKDSCFVSIMSQMCSGSCHLCCYPNHSFNTPSVV